MRHFEIKSSFRRTLCASFAIAALSALSLTTAHAQNYPSKPIKFVVPFSAGSATDNLGRILAQAMGDADWTLEVTSPGVERPLTLPRHWRRAVGRNVKVTFADGREDMGRILEFDEETGEGVFNFKGATRKRNIANITKAIVQVEFNRKLRDEELELIDDGRDPDVTDADADFAQTDEEE